MKELIRRWLGLEELYEWSQIIKAESQARTAAYQAEPAVSSPEPEPEHTAESAPQPGDVIEPEPQIKKGYADASIRRTTRG